MANNNNSGCLGFIFQLMGIKPNENNEVVFPYAIRDDFLSSAEKSFYMVLRKAIDNKYTIFTKVGLKDILFVKEKDYRKRTLFYNKISLKHVDFLICESDTVKPILAIELDDTSHGREDRQERDYFVNKAFEAAGLKLLRVENRKAYVLDEVVKQITAALVPKAVLPVQLPEEKLQTDIPVCPKCGIQMTLRTTKRGENKGKRFYGCTNFPKCREIKEISDAK
jgi:hypothetical protein